MFHLTGLLEYMTALLEYTNLFVLDMGYIFQCEYCGEFNVIHQYFTQTNLSPFL